MVRAGGGRAPGPERRHQGQGAHVAEHAESCVLVFVCFDSQERGVSFDSQERVVFKAYIKVKAVKALRDPRKADSNTILYV